MLKTFVPDAGGGGDQDCGVLGDPGPVQWRPVGGGRLEGLVPPELAEERQGLPGLGHWWWDLLGDRRYLGQASPVLLVLIIVLEQRFIIRLSKSQSG